MTSGLVQRSAIMVILLFACGFTGIASASSAPPVIFNGGFELNACSRWAGVNYLTSGSTAIPGWVIGGDSIDCVSDVSWDPSEGLFSIDLDGFNPGSVSQTFDTISGHTYQVQFDLSGNPYANGNGYPIKNLEVSAPGFAQSYTFDVTGHTYHPHINYYTGQNMGGGMGWETETFTFTASGNSSTLTFLSTDVHSENAYGPALDNVRVVDTNPVPLPAAIWLLGSGLLGLIGIRRKIG